MCLTGIASAQQPPAGKFGFAIHTPGDDSAPVWTWLPESGHIVKILNCSAYPHDAHWDIVHANDARPTVLEIAFAVAENAVVFAVTADYGNRFRATGTPVESGPLPQPLTIGSYFASETRSITLDSLPDFGLPAITIDLVVTPTGHAASLTGSVTDLMGRPVGKVTLQLTAAHSAQEGVSTKPYTTTTAGDGSYSFAQLEPGAYTVEVNQKGYAPARSQVTLSAGQQATEINLVLQPM